MRRAWKWIGLAWGLSLLIWGVPRCFDSWQLEHRQAALLKAIEQRTPKLAVDLVSTGYQDDWGYSAEMIRKAMNDVSAQFLTLKLHQPSPVWRRLSREAQCTGTLTLSGHPVTPIGELILTEAAQLQTPFTFVWRKEGWGAWTWKLTAIKNAALESPSGYEPGSLSEVR